MHLGILASHPIQYQAPWFRALSRECELDVFFAHRQSAAGQAASGFGVKFDWDVDLLSGYRHSFLKNVSPAPGVNRFDGCDTPEIFEVIRNGSFDAFIVCGWYLKSYRQAMGACRAAGVPVLVRGDSQLRTPRPLVKRLAMEFTQRRLMRQFDGFLTVGQRNREYLEHFGAPPKKIFSAPHFVDNEWFQTKAASGTSKNEIRKSWGADAKTIVALFVGKFIPKKHPLDLLRAVVGLRSKVGFSLLPVFIGAGELENELRNFVRRENLPAHFAGFKNQTELPACYAAADVLVLPSDGGETWGLVVNEAMACGCPAIVSEAAGCAPDLIVEGKTGFIFPLGNVEKLKEKLSAFSDLKSTGHDFAHALSSKLADFNVAAAVRGTLRAARELAIMKK